MNCSHENVYYSKSEDAFFCSGCRQNMGKAFYDAFTALEMVSAGIWRDKKMNACGLSGPAVTVHAVEQALQHLVEENHDPE